MGFNLGAFVHAALADVSKGAQAVDHTIAGGAHSAVRGATPIAQTVQHAVVGAPNTVHPGVQLLNELYHAIHPVSVIPAGNPHPIGQPKGAAFVQNDATAPTEGLKIYPHSQPQEPGFADGRLQLDTINNPNNYAGGSDHLSHGFTSPGGVQGPQHTGQWLPDTPLPGYYPGEPTPNVIYQPKFIPTQMVVPRNMGYKI